MSQLLGNIQVQLQVMNIVGLSYYHHGFINLGKSLEYPLPPFLASPFEFFLGLKRSGYS